MTSAMSRHIPLSEFPVYYRVEVEQAGATTLEWSARRISAATPASGTSGNIWIELDWSKVAGVWPTGLWPTSRIAEEFAIKLRTPGFLPDYPTGTLPVELPVHLVGHSRGGAMMIQLAEHLGKRGLWVSQVTTLDPHPILGFDAQIQPLTIRKNVLFADNYRQTGQSPRGVFLAGSWQRTPVWNDTILHFRGGYSGLAGMHSDVHLWYHGTCDTTANAYNGDHFVTQAMRDDPGWYQPEEEGGRKTGYYFSRLLGGVYTNCNQRPISGTLHGNPYREPWNIEATGSAVWPNIEIFNLTSREAVQQGDSFQVQAVFFDKDNDATITFGLDQNRNPYDGYGSPLRTRTTASIGGNANQPRTITESLSTAGVPLGTNYVYAKITRGTRTRYYYSHSPVVIEQGVTALSIQSNPSGVGIQVSPPDKGGLQNGTTPFSRSYDPGTSVLLTAPSSASGRPFKEWRRDGIVYSHNRSVTVEVDSPRTMSAVYEVLDSDIWVAGSANPEPVLLSGGRGNSWTVDIPILNRKTTSTTVNVSRLGNAANWITLTDGTSFVLDGSELKYYRARISIPSSATAGEHSGSISFNGIEQVFVITVALAGHPHRVDFSGTANIDARYDTIIKEFDAPYRDYHDISGASQMPVRPTARFTDEEVINTDRIALIVNGEKLAAASNQNLMFYISGNYVGQLLASQISGSFSHTFSNWYWWHHLRRDGQASSVHARLSTFNSSDTTPRWRVIDDITMIIRQTYSAWSGHEFSIPNVHWNRIQDGYMLRARFTAHVDSVQAAGRVALYNNKDQIGFVSVSSSDVGRTRSWSLRRSELDRDSNRLVLKGETEPHGNGTRVRFSNMQLEITFRSQVPELLFWQEASPMSINVGSSATVTVRIENSAEDSTTARSTSLTCAALPSGLSLVSGSLSNSRFGEDLRDGDSDQHSYVVSANAVGRYTIAGATYEYRTIEGDRMVLQSNPIVLEVRGGGLAVDPVITERHAGGSVLLECTANVTAAIGGGVMSDASVQGQIFRQDGATWSPVGDIIHLGYDPDLQRFKGASPWINEAGNYKFIVTAERDLYDTTMSGEYPFVVTGPPSYALSVTSSGTDDVVIESYTGHGGTTPFDRTVVQGTAVDLTAPEFVGTGANRMRFTEWQGDINTAAREISFDMDAAKSLTAHYVDAPPNNPPHRPDLISPANNATGVSLTPTLEAGPFSDPDPGDTHSGSRWMVYNTAGTEIIWDSGIGPAETAIQVPGDTLSYSTEYMWGVWYYDSQGATYDGLTPSWFTTMADPASDTTPPTIAITSPTSAATWTSPNATMNIGGTASDNVGVTSVKVLNFRDVGEYTATGTTSWQYNNLPLFQGQNRITVTAGDAAGNTGTDTITVMYNGDTRYDDVLRSGGVMQEIEFPDNLTPGSTVTVRWKVLSYVPVVSRVYAGVPGGWSFFRYGTYTGFEQSPWNLDGRHAGVYAFECEWPVPEHSGEFKVWFNVAQMDAYQFMIPVIPDGVDARPDPQYAKLIERTILPGGTGANPVSDPDTYDSSMRFENVDQCKMRSSATVVDISMSDNLTPGAQVTVEWKVHSYVPVNGQLLLLNLDQQEVWTVSNGTQIGNPVQTTFNFQDRATGTRHYADEYTFRATFTVPDQPGTQQVFFRCQESGTAGSPWMAATIAAGIDGRPAEYNGMFGRFIERTINP